MTMPLHDHPCYGMVLCPFGRPGTHAEAAWNTVSVADLSVGGWFPVLQARVAWDRSCMFDAWHIAHNLLDLRFDPTPSVRTKFS